jgi:ubiquinol-cytochrome c reductase core subunit 2
LSFRAYFAEVLAQNVTIPKFAHYVLPEVRSHVEAESAAALADPKIAVLEALHQAAFRQGLGNSLYAKVSPNLSTPALKQYLRISLV